MFKLGSRTLPVFRARLGRLAAARHPAFFFNPGVEGYCGYVFGGRAGPAIAVRNVFHEMAHAAQFGEDNFRHRAVRHGFVFKVRKVTVFGESYPEPNTAQATEREMDTFAHEWHLLRNAGYRLNLAQFLQDKVQVMNYMPDWYMVNGENEKARHATLRALLLEKLESKVGEDAHPRLEAWLDRTQKRLKREKDGWPLSPDAKDAAYCHARPIGYSCT
jgi:hypothetical protein